MLSTRPSTCADHAAVGRIGSVTPGLRQCCAGTAQGSLSSGAMGDQEVEAWDRPMTGWSGPMVVSAEGAIG